MTTFFGDDLEVLFMSGGGSASDGGGQLSTYATAPYSADFNILAENN